MRNVQWIGAAIGVTALTVFILAQSVPAQDELRRDRFTRLQDSPLRPSSPLMIRQAAQNRVPDVAGDVEETSREWLQDAQDAVQRRQPVQADELLERAANLLRPRTNEPNAIAVATRNARLLHVTQAREALWRRDRREAARHIALAIEVR